MKHRCELRFRSLIYLHRCCAFLFALAGLFLFIVQHIGSDCCLGVCS